MKKQVKKAAKKVSVAKPVEAPEPKPEKPKKAKPLGDIVIKADMANSPCIATVDRGAKGERTFVVLRNASGPVEFLPVERADEPLLRVVLAPANKELGWTLLSLEPK